jgi:hypothetical protein
MKPLVILEMAASSKALLDSKTTMIHFLMVSALKSFLSRLIDLVRYQIRGIEHFLHIPLAIRRSLE